MNYSLCDLPDSGDNPVVFMDITLKGESLGRIFIRLFREVFPAGVENFVRIATGKTYRVVKKEIGKYKYKKEVRRTYEGTKSFSFLYNNYIVGGDIYTNNGKSAGTIYCDKPIPPCFGEYFFPHDTKGLISLVPFKDEESGQLFFDSTFMITLDDVKPSNNLTELNCDQVVIGQIYNGLEVITKMNELIFPYAGRRYPEFIIGECGVYKKINFNRRPRCLPRPDRVRYTIECGPLQCPQIECVPNTVPPTKCPP